MTDIRSTWIVDRLEHDGNFHQLMKLLQHDDDSLSRYLRRTTNFTSPRAQDEIIELFSRAVVTKVANDVQKDGFFAVMVDGTQDVTSTEQESVCFRHVDAELNIIEDFVGLYEEHLGDVVRVGAHLELAGLGEAQG